MANSHTKTFNYVLCFKVLHSDHLGVHESHEALSCGERMNSTGFDTNIAHLENEYAAKLGWDRKGLRIVLTGLYPL